MTTGFYGVRTKRLGDIIGDVLGAGQKVVSTAGGYVNQATQIGNAVDPGSNSGGSSIPVHGQHPTEAPASSSSASPMKVILGGLALGGAFVWWKRR